MEFVAGGVVSCGLVLTPRTTNRRVCLSGLKSDVSVGVVQAKHTFLTVSIVRGPLGQDKASAT